MLLPRRFPPRQLAPRALLVASSLAAPPRRRFASVCAGALRSVEADIAAGLRARLLSLSAASKGLHGAENEAPRVTLVGRHSAEFAAALRGARAAGAAVAPVDVLHRSIEEVAALMAESQTQLVITAEPCWAPAAALSLAAGRLGALTVPAAVLRAEGQGLAERGERREESGGAARAAPPVLLPTKGGDSGLLRSAEISGPALEARVRSALATWGFSDADTVLALGLRSDASAALVDAVEAPLSVGASVHFSGDKAGSEEVWDLWSALRDETDATIAFVDASWCWKLLDAHAQLASPVRQELAARWAARPLRHTVALAPTGATLSMDLARRWEDVFRCPLTWLFSCAEAGSLYAVRPRAAGQRMPHAVGPEAMGLEVRRGKAGELLVRGEGVFQRYLGRPRSSEEAFAGSEGFCRTGHRVTGDGPTLSPAPLFCDNAADRLAQRYLQKGTGKDDKLMAADWYTKKVAIRRYYWWRGKQGHRIYTKKHNNVRVVYQAKYR